MKLKKTPCIHLFWIKEEAGLYQSESPIRMHEVAAVGCIFNCARRTTDCPHQFLILSNDFCSQFRFFSHKSQDLLFQLHHWWMRFRLDGFVLCVSSNPLFWAQALDNISENCTLKCGNWSFSFQAVCSKYICQVLELDRPSCARFDELVFASPNF